ncbi:MAG: glycosyltransferase family 9 protein [Candidatus Aminicenantes bacterium]|nr:MAG: glycosyltransferase family 9 protein [Candidatus Aminicenantes bacterium]
MKPFQQNNNILFIRLRLLGDIIFTIPSIQIFKRNYPGIKVYYVVEEQFKEIGELIPGIHQLIVIPRKMGIKKMWRFRKDIQKIGIDTVIDFHSGPKSAQLTWLTGAKLRIGYKTPNRDWAYHRLTPRTCGNTLTHSVYNQARLLDHLGIAVDMDMLPQYPEITIDEKQISEGVKRVVQKEKKVVIHVGAGNAFRDWGIESFSSLIYHLKCRGVRVFLTGNGAEEEKRGNYLGNLLAVDNFTGKLSIAELLYLISKSDVYVGADSGPLHLASLTAAPLVGLYGPNTPKISGPWRKKNVTIIQHQMECQPCTQRKCKYGIIPCMKNIRTDEVYEAINRYLR